jgi:hypothetical protein
MLVRQAQQVQGHAIRSQADDHAAGGNRAMGNTIKSLPNTFGRD